jgi:hypothetical protein
MTWPNQITGANGGGPSLLQAVSLAGAVAQFCRTINNQPFAINSVFRSIPRLPHAINRSIAPV